MGGQGSSNITVHVRFKTTKEYVVHYRNENDRGYFTGLYTKDLGIALQEFSRRVLELNAEEQSTLASEKNRGITRHTIAEAWVKRLGQWHIMGEGSFSSETKCGKPMLGNNYAKIIPDTDREKCEECHNG